MTNRLVQLTQIGQTGRSEDIDTLMQLLAQKDDLLTTKLVDNALNQVDTLQGCLRIQHYLFNGELIQRNFAALYFKRRGRTDLLVEAVAQGKIDEIQAFLV
ncbi:MAG: hypothetical protein CVU39_21110 [Chloroflexi bacterium HGW-Chloroflexi-10]|nr:MAG: hypothetical protein CVU39_21110 [Chloroflexi bacterium HGW-Chloroflexi-10]